MTNRDASHLIGRVVVRKPPPGTVVAVRATLTRALRVWPPEARVKFLVCPGGLLRAPWPSDWDGRKGWESAGDLAPLIRNAQRALDRVLDSTLLAQLRPRARYLSLGIDLETKRGDDRLPHAEFVAVVDLARPAKGTLWTGKSYPTPSQERALVRVTDLNTHQMTLGGDRVLVLGCHDLNMFSGRSWANQNPGGLRRQACRAQRKLTRDFRPTIVLHHPHTTDTPRIWTLGWAGLRNLLAPTAWASGIAYCNPWGAPREPLAKVLANTCNGDSCLDLIS